MRLLPPNKTVLGFFIRVVAGYSASLALWPILGNLYSDLYRWMANPVFHWIPPQGRAWFVDEPEYDRQRQRERTQGYSEIRDQTFVKLRNNKNSYARWALSGSTRHTGFVPTALCLSFILATPIALKRRMSSACLGMLLLHLTLILRWCILILNEFSKGDSIAMFTLGPWLKSALKFLVDPICASVLLLAFVAPVLIWVLVTFRRSDFVWIRDVPLT